MKVNVIKQMNNIHSDIKYWCHTYGDTIYKSKHRRSLQYGSSTCFREMSHRGFITAQLYVYCQQGEINTVLQMIYGHL